MASQTCDKMLEDVHYFAYILHLQNPVEIYTVVIGNERPARLKANLHVVLPFEEKNIYSHAFTERLVSSTFELFSPKLDWDMIVERSLHFVNHKDLRIKFKDVIFGVWGEEQRAHLAQFLDNVVDIAPLIMTKVLKFDQENGEIIKPYENCLQLPHLTIGELFLCILCKHADYIKKLFPNTLYNKNLPEFQNWIQYEAWSTFLRIPDCKHPINTGKYARIYLKFKSCTNPECLKIHTHE